MCRRRTIRERGRVRGPLYKPSRLAFRIIRPMLTTKQPVPMDCRSDIASSFVLSRSCVQVSTYQVYIYIYIYISVFELSNTRQYVSSYFGDTLHWPNYSEEFNLQFVRIMYIGQNLFSDVLKNNCFDAMYNNYTLKF